ncbi:AMP-binding protein [Pseudonocardia sp. WMMC193]|uniref:AMP-binding enzyme n=1 Tax=Pseudonocardia sp. WMMC193 TaxID=2911965 RepID=UPI001F47F6ED|nr:AMP-binding protein [Pseudonocardia sp. WMMC193]MCF7549129.1 AMP-binding protein [Pseudonocardia sp. WMMC193]
MTPVLGGAALPADLAARVGAGAAELQRRGIGPGARVAIGDGDVLSWFLACDRRGAAALVLEPGWSARERAGVLADARPDTVVEGTPDAGSGTVEDIPVDLAAPFYLPTTSGSSGTPKVLQRSRASWLRSFEALGAVPGPVLVAGPLSSSLFLFGALHALWCGAELRLAPRLSAAAARGAATVHVVPAMLPELAAVPFELVVCGGAHVPEGLRRPELLEYYGSAEHSLIAIRRDGVLRPVPGVDLEVRAGELWVRSPLAVDGRLRGGVLDPSPEWTSVGDRVDIVDGVLTVHGRESATIGSGGFLVAAEEVEAVLRAVPGVSDVVVAGSPHPRLGAVVTAVVEGEPVLADLRAAARAGLDPRKRPRIWLRAKEIPRTPAGKPARAALTAALAAGTLAAEPLR